MHLFTALVHSRSAAALLVAFGVTTAANAAPLIAVIPTPVSSHSVSGDVVSPGAVYSDVTNASGYYYSADDATSVGSVTYTGMMADDLTPIGGGTVSQVSVVIYNANGSTVTAGLELSFYDNTGDGGGSPGNLLSAFSVGSLSIPAGYTTQPINFSGVGFVFPSTTTWAGLSFNNASNPSTTADELNNLGQGLDDPPDAGSSADEFYNGSTDGAPYTSNSPPGTLEYFGGSPVANFGWEIVVSPEPASAILTAAALLALASHRTRSRRQNI
jgi:hypothetical protein